LVSLAFLVGLVMFDLNLLLLLLLLPSYYYYHIIIIITTILLLLHSSLNFSFCAHYASPHPCFPSVYWPVAFERRLPPWLIYY
jgi:hypothetical protein